MSWIISHDIVMFHAHVTVDPVQNFPLNRRGASASIVSICPRSRRSNSSSVGLMSTSCFDEEREHGQIIQSSKIFDH